LTGYVGAFRLGLDLALQRPIWITQCDSAAFFFYSGRHGAGLSVAFLLGLFGVDVDHRAASASVDDFDLVFEDLLKAIQLAKIMALAGMRIITVRHGTLPLLEE
jgi:hypothetical protein